MSELLKSVSSEFTEYLRDESRVTGNAKAIAFPKTEHEVASLVKNLYAKDIKITLQGARTGLAAGAVPHGGHIINMSKMNKVLSMRKDEKNFYITVQPGLVLSKLREMITNCKFNTHEWDSSSKLYYKDFCEADEQFFCPDPTETSATLGGMVACNASGARSYLYGSTRKHISALNVVLFNGGTLTLKRNEVFADGRNLNLITNENNSFNIKLPSYTMPKTKNASGYYIEDNMDAIDLFIGSDGTLGVITEIELKLMPLPKYIWGVNCFFKNFNDSVDFVLKIREQKNIAAIEFFDGDALSILINQKDNNPAFAQLPAINKDMKAAIYIELHCTNEQKAISELQALGSAMNNCGANSNDTWVARTIADRNRLLFFRHAVPESVNMLIDTRKKTDPIITKLGTDMSVPDEKLKEVIQLYRSSLKEYGLESAIWGHIGDNHLHVNLLPNNEAEYLKGKQLYKKWSQSITKMGGAVSAEHGVGKLKAEFLLIMYGQKHVSEMAELKLTLDPKALLSSGNLFTPLKRGDD